jgi:hypothetical protein
MKTQAKRSRVSISGGILAAAVILLSGCSNNSTAKQSAASQAVVQSTMQHANDMAAWRAAHPGQEHP